MSYLTIENAVEYAAELLEIYPQLVTWADKARMGDKSGLEKLNDFFLTQFAKHTREEYVWTHKFADSEQFLREKADIIGVPFEIIKKTAILLTLHIRISKGTLANMLKFRADDEHLVEYITKMEEARLIQMDHKRQYVCDPHDMLTPSESVELDLFQSNPPLLVNPRGREKEFYKKLRRTIWSKEADGTKHVPKSFLYAEASQTYEINYEVWDAYVKDHIVYPGRKAEDSDDDYKKKCAMARLQHARLIFYMEVFRRLGIKRIWFLHFLDHRGRNYPIGDLFNPQGTDAKKALLCFVAEPITERGKYWLPVSIANQWNGKINGKDLDKQIFEVRKKWFDDMLHPILENTPRYQDFLKAIKPFVETADSPACFMAQVLNMWHIYRAEDWGLTPKVWVITHWDQTSSGYQFLSMMSGDLRMMKMTNVLGGDVQYDCYTILYQEMIRAGIPNSYTRKQMKEGAFVPGVYGSTAAPEELFHGNKVYIEIYNNVMNTFIAWRYSRMFLKIWEKKSLKYQFWMPDGFLVYKINKGTREDKWNEVELEFKDGDVVIVYHRKAAPNPYSKELGTAIVHGEDGFNAREILRSCYMIPPRVKYLRKVLLHSPKPDMNNPKVKRFAELLELARRFKFYSLRLFELLSIDNVGLLSKQERRILWKRLDDLPEKAFQVSEIHDSFGILPNYTDDLMKQERIIMSDLAKSRFLQVVLEEYMQMPVNEDEFPKLSPEIIHQIRTQGRILA